MNTSYRDRSDHSSAIPVSSFAYRDICDASASPSREVLQAEAESARELERRAQERLTEQQVRDLVLKERSEAVAETEKRLAMEYEGKVLAYSASIQRTLDLFVAERKSYFARVESDVVHLALAIAAKILHREAQVDPLLIVTLVRIAVEKLHDGSSVTVRVSPERSDKWRECLAAHICGSNMTLVEDSRLTAGDCILETDLGSSNFSIDSQLREVEQGFCDLLAQRPVIK